MVCRFQAPPAHQYFARFELVIKSTTEKTDIFWLGTNPGKQSECLRMPHALMVHHGAHSMRNHADLECLIAYPTIFAVFEGLESIKSFKQWALSTWGRLATHKVCKIQTREEGTLRRVKEVEGTSWDPCKGLKISRLINMILTCSAQLPVCADLKALLESRGDNKTLVVTLKTIKGTA